jgi:hypothetical protein
MEIQMAASIYKPKAVSKKPKNESKKPKANTRCFWLFALDLVFGLQLFPVFAYGLQLIAYRCIHLA